MPESPAETPYLHAVAHKPEVDEPQLIPVEAPPSRIQQGLAFAKYAGIASAAFVVYKGARLMHGKIDNYGR